jgi:hypothetical protein
MPSLNFEGIGISNDKNLSGDGEENELSNRTHNPVNLNVQIDEQKPKSSRSNHQSNSSTNKKNSLEIEMNAENDYQTLTINTKEFESFSTTRSSKSQNKNEQPLNETENEAEIKLATTNRSHKSQLNQILNSYRKENDHIDESSTETIQSDQREQTKKKNEDSLTNRSQISQKSLPLSGRKEC